MAARYRPGTALVVVDVQNDFADPEGNLFVPGAEVAVARAVQEVHAAQAADVPVLYTQDWHPPDTPHFAKDGGTWPVHCVRDTWGAAFHPDLPVVGPVVRKGVDGGDGYSGFSVRDPASGAQHATGLERLLRDRAVQRVVVVGIAQDVCVKDTALDAVGAGFAVTLVADATAPVDLQPGDGDRALQELAAAGVEIVRGPPGR